MSDEQQRLRWMKVSGPPFGRQERSQRRKHSQKSGSQEAEIEGKWGCLGHNTEGYGCPDPQFPRHAVRCGEATTPNHLLDSSAWDSLSLAVSRRREPFWVCETGQPNLRRRKNVGQVLDQHVAQKKKQTYFWFAC